MQSGWLFFFLLFFKLVRNKKWGDKERRKKKKKDSCCHGRDGVIKTTFFCRRRCPFGSWERGGGGGFFILVAARRRQRRRQAQWRQSYRDGTMMYTRLASNFVFFFLFYFFLERENVERKPGKTLNSINFDRNYIFWGFSLLGSKEKTKINFFQKEKGICALLFRTTECLYTSLLCVPCY